MNEHDIARAAGLDAAQRELLARLLAEEGLLPAADDRIPPRDPGEPLVLSHDQLRLWYLDQLAPGEPIYNIPAAVAVPAPVDVAVLERAVTELQRRHEILRLRVPARVGAPAPELAPLTPFRVHVIDLDPQGAQLQTLLAAEAARPFDLAAGPLLRMTLLRTPGSTWALSLTLHHLIADAWSVGLLVDELGALCAALAAGRPAPAPASQLQYADYAAWQRRTRTPDTLAADLTWWAEQLADLRPVELPADRPLPARPSHRGGQCSATLPSALHTDLLALAKRRGDTPFTLVYAALCATLARLTGRHDIAVGTAHAGRDHPDLQPLLGFFANTLVLRTDLGGDPTANTLLERCRHTVHAAHAHAHVPFGLVVQRLGGDRSAGHQPLFRVFFLLSRAAPQALARHPVHAGRARFDLMIHAVDHGDRLELVAEYSHDRFDRVSVERLLAQLQTALTGLLRAPLAPLSRLPVMDAAEREFVRSHAAGPPVPAPADGVVARFLAQVARRPEHPAGLVLAADPQDPGRPLSYRELARWAARLAATLRARGVGPGDPVALLLPRDGSLLAAMLAVLALGATLVPLSDHLPPERRAAILRETHPRALISPTPGPADLPRVDPAELEPAAPELAATERPGHRAYVLHTSGSTGRPKGVAVPAQALADLLAAVSQRLALTPDDRVLAITSVIFDIAFVELLAPLVVGATVVLAPEEVRGDPRWLAPAIAAAAVTVAQSTPSTWAALIAAGWRGAPGLRLIAAGEVLSAALARALLARGQTLWNGYGPTEATIYATFERVDPELGVTIGRPLPGRRALILGPDLDHAPVGAPGELHLGGGLAEGYLGRPAETAARFIPDPERPGERLYATGDRARLRADGRIEFLGRSDDQVKVRGFRIELAEVEGALAALPGVRRAGVHVHADAHPDAHPDASLEAFLELAPDAVFDPGALHHALAARLPDYMLPARYHPVAALPTTASGKLDRGALARLRASASRPALAPPRGPTETAIAAIWAELLAADNIDRHDNFYLRGGHSLLAVRLAVRLEEVTGVRLPLRAIVASPTLAGLAATLDARRDPHPEPAPLPAVPAIEPSVGDTAPLSPGQAAMWRFCEALPSTPFFNLTSAFIVRADLPAWLLESAVAALVQRHQTLRTSFEAHGDEVLQRIHPDNPALLHLVDLSDVPADEHAARVQHELAQARARPLDLRARELLRVLLIRLGPDCQVINLTVHHIAADGWSVGILAAELGALCEAGATGNPADLPPPRFTFADYATWQRRRAADLYPSLLAYWRDRLHDLRPFTLPADHPAPPAPPALPDLCLDAGHLHHRFDPALARAVAERCNATGTTPYVVLLAAFELALGRRVGTGDVRISTLVANRDQPGSEGVVGNFLNTLIVRTQLDLHAGLALAVPRVADSLAGALAHQELPLDLLLDGLDLDLPRADLARVQVMSRPRPVASPARGPVARQAELLGMAPPMVMTFDLYVQIDPDLDDLALDIRYRNDRNDPATLEALVREIEALVFAS